MPPKQDTDDAVLLGNKSQLTLPVTSTHPYPNVTLDKNIDFDSVNDILSKVFKHESFRTELQRDAVVEACQFRRDLFVSLPTGSGKSLIYQLPAMYKNYGLTIVVSPLVALISNQITNAKKLGIPCATINSHMSKTWNTQVKAELRDKDSKLRLLYITPETLCSDHFQPYLNTLSKNRALKLFAIDEAHCVSSWGHEFRPDYLKLGQLRYSYPDVPIVALTATATSKVLKDILNVLNLKDPKHVIASSFRENLYYDVIIADDLGPAGLLTNLANFVKTCLKLKIKSNSCNKETVSTLKERTIDRMKDQAKKRKTTDISRPVSQSSSASQFVSAATLLTIEHSSSSSISSNTKRKSSTQLKEPPKATKILAKETSKITSFFKPKPVDIIDLTSDDDDDTKTRQTAPTTAAEDVIVVADLPKMKRIPKVSRSTFITADKLSTDSSSRTDITPEADKKSKVAAGEKAAGVGIIYCRTKLNCEELAGHLEKVGIPARAYHSGLTPKQRTEIETLWMDEKVLVICATISFGMGIDKANVRVVVHFNMSQSLANYYQESGRAGRDGKRANCRLYYSSSDQSAITFLLRKDLEMEDDGEHKYGPEAIKRKKQSARAAIERFERMVEYCRCTNKCRHMILAKEFSLADEASFLSNGCGKSCDYCFRSREMTAARKKSLSSNPWRRS